MTTIIKKTLKSISFICLLFTASQVVAQTIPQFTTPFSDGWICGFNPEVLAERNRQAYLQLNERVANNSMIQCGRFNLNFQDIANNNGIGFDDPVNGQNRRDVLCAVVNYLQQIFDIPTGDSSQMEVIVDQSYHPQTQLAPSPGILAVGGNFYNNGNTQPAVVNGYLFDHITTGIDPAPGIPDGHIVVNFHPLVPWHDNITPIIDDCEVDLYSVLLHEMTHVLGFLSNIIEVNKIPAVGSLSASGQPIFSRLDDKFLYYGQIDSAYAFRKILNFNHLNNTYTLLNDSAALSSYDVWTDSINVTLSPGNYTNQPIQTNRSFKQGSSLSHFAGIYMSYSYQGYKSPGFTPTYVMKSSISRGQSVRTYSPQEIRFLNEFGYSLSPQFLSSSFDNTSYTVSNILINHPPHSSKKIFFPDMIYPMNTVENVEYPDDTTLTPSDFTVTSCNYLDIDLGAQPNIGDQDGDSIKVFPGSLYNIRGCGNGNNHNQLQVLTGVHGDIIRFTPRVDFIGRAQFGFHLWDGKEKGSFMIFTIDVKPDSCFNNNGEIVINGNFEQGSEVAIIDSMQITNSIVKYGLEGRYSSGIHFSDGHPLSQIMLPSFFNDGLRDRIVSGGYIIKGSYVQCYQSDSTGIVTNPIIGEPHTACPANGQIIYGNDFFGMAPDPAINGGERFGILGRNNYNNFQLAPVMQPCQRYKLCFDFNFSPLYFTGWFASGTNTTIVMNFTNNYLLGDALPTVLPQSDTFNLSSNGLGNSWEHFETHFTYCGSPTPNFLTLRAINLNPLQFAVETFIDNLSLVPDTSTYPPFTVHAGIDTIIHCGNSVQLQAVNSNAQCTVSYIWSPSTSLNNNSLINPIASPLTETTYILTASDGCNTANDTVTVFVEEHMPTITASTPTTFCIGDSVVLDGGSGFLMYHWSTGSNAQVITAFNTQTIYLTITDTSGCIGKDTIAIIKDMLPIPALTLDSINCILYSANVQGLNYQWYFNDTILAGQTGYTVPVNLAGTYSLVVADSICNSYSDTISISCSTVGIDPVNAEQSEITVQNPFWNQLVVFRQGKNNMALKVEVFQVTGKIIKTFIEESTGNFVIDLSTLPPALYFIRFTDLKKGAKVTLKIVKIH